jgi:hypothetical protein
VEKSFEAVERWAKDLRSESPRDPEEELGGFAGAARCIDKCRATLLGWQGEYVYACPMDQRFLTAAGIGANELKSFVATGASDDEISRWIHEHAPAGATG